ncbi:MAG: DUF4198 domain-containing protein [Rubrivivax sp.]|nr:MAG: DUF4198 domain-containing protein [Rubrivivax sp.]
MPTMNKFLLKGLMVTALGLSGLPAANAHYLWIERSGADAMVFFGEYEESARERSPGRLDEIPGPRGLILSGKETKPVELQKRPAGFAFASAGSPQQPLLVEESAIGVKDWTKSGIGIVKPYFYARHQALEGSAAQATSALTLDILPQDQAGSFRVYFRGKPLPKVDVKIVAPNTWAQEGRTDDNGMVRLPLPWKGQYIVQVVYLESGAGEYEGKAYQAKRHRATLTFATSGGDATFSDKSKAMP